MALEDSELTVRVGKQAGEGPGFDLTLRYTNTGANAFRLFVYTILVLAVLCNLGQDTRHRRGSDDEDNENIGQCPGHEAHGSVHVRDATREV